MSSNLESYIDNLIQKSKSSNDFWKSVDLTLFNHDFKCLKEWDWLK